MPLAHRSVGELPEFPFGSFEEFREAVREGRARVWVRYDWRSAWTYSSRAERAGQVALTGLALFASLVFALLAVVTRDRWWLCGAPAALLGLLVASPSPGLISGGGCVAVPLCAAGVIGSVFLDRSLFWAGVAGFVCWFLACAGQGIADATLREAMVQSEQAFLHLYQRRAITKVEALEQPAEPETE